MHTDHPVTPEELNRDRLPNLAAYPAKHGLIEPDLKASINPSTSSH
jgi:hypothetical protein